MVVVAAVVLLMAAITVMFITRGSITNFSSTLFSSGARRTCLSKKSTYCSTNPGGKWEASNYDYQGQTCSQILEKGKFLCEDDYWVGKKGGLSDEKCSELCGELAKTSSGGLKWEAEGDLPALCCDEGCINDCDKIIKEECCDGADALGSFNPSEIPYCDLECN